MPGDPLLPLEPAEQQQQGQQQEAEEMPPQAQQAQQQQGAMGTPYPRYHQLPSPPAVVSSTAAGVHWRSIITHLNGR